MPVPILLLMHLSLMAAAATGCLGAVFIARKRSKGWLLKHKRSALSAAACGLAGVICIAALKFSTGHAHLRTVHAIIGAVALGLLLITPTLGLVVARGVRGGAAIHRWAGRLTAVLVLAGLIAGVIQYLEITGVLKEDA